jgi:hypothetical protein
LQQLSNQTLLKAIIKSEATEKFSKLDSTLWYIDPSLHLDSNAPHNRSAFQILMLFVLHYIRVGLLLPISTITRTRIN